jgi:hypothetical protein
LPLTVVEIVDEGQRPLKIDLLSLKADAGVLTPKERYDLSMGKKLVIARLQMELALALVNADKRGVNATPYASCFSVCTPHTIAVVQDSLRVYSDKIFTWEPGEIRCSKGRRKRVYWVSIRPELFPLFKERAMRSGKEDAA